ncbi:hypothetical protein EMPS_06935 [Entomortierella parvispora]|uniref:DUF1308 domain-containing protein n=1 Tax=Entomortierella parvispora TaxID=205924 RepID=A0A9P3HDD6_9FUNG|nr:hypothetical protein EMPS_06935 [Entomortierella parvispora]
MDLLQRAQFLLQECNDIISSLEAWRACNSTLEVDGLQKMTSTLLAEQKFLEKVAATPAEEIKAVQITSTNVPYLKSLVWALIQSRNPVAINKSFTYSLDPYTVIEPSEKFKAFNPPVQQQQQQQARNKHQQSRNGNATETTQTTTKGKRSVMKLTTSKPLSTALKNEQWFQVKVDVVADHGMSWLRINAGSSWSLIHEFAGMEDFSDEEEYEDEDEDEDNEESGSGSEQCEDDVDTDTQLSSQGRPLSRGKPVHVSKDTHADMVLLTRSLVLAADQNRLHYRHRPEVSLRFASVLPEDDNYDALKDMIEKSVKIGKKAQSRKSGKIHDFPVPVIFGPLAPEPITSKGQDQNSNEDGNESVEKNEGDSANSTISTEFLQSTASVVATTSIDQRFSPFSIPMVVDDMNLFSKTLNLDITTLMALSSFLCHTIRPDPKLFKSPPLILQAQQENDHPLLPLLSKVFEGRERLVMTRVAATRFMSILKIIGGPEEQWRGAVMLHDPLSEECECLDETKQEDKKRQIRERWVRGSDWAREYGLFDQGPPHIEIVEDSLDEDDIFEEVANEGNIKDDEDDKSDEDSENGSASGSSSALDVDDMSAKPSSGTTSTMRMRQRKELNMTELHAKIFLSGYERQQTTITANMVGFRTVTRDGLLPKDISVWFHSPRSLAEAKLPSGYVVKGGELHSLK